MYDDHFEQFERHFDCFRDRVNYDALMHDEDGASGSLPADCEPRESNESTESTGWFQHNVFADEWTEEDLSDFLESE